MNKITFQNQGKTFVRISKAKARKMYNKGLTIAMCPAKLNPRFMQGAFLSITDKARITEYSNAINDYENSFDYMVNMFEAYNCRMSETGYYTTFYTLDCNL